MKVEEDSSRKHDRVLEIYQRLLSGELLVKEELAEEFHVNPKSIQRDIESLRDFCANRIVDGEEHSEIIYDRTAKGYKLLSSRNIMLTNSELFTVTKILLESRALNQMEMKSLVTKLVDACIPPKEKKKMKELTANELHHYVEPRHQKELIEKVWDLGSAVYQNRITQVEYQKTNGEITNRLVKPVGIMCSEYYFYLIAYPGDADKKHMGYPTVYRIDRILHYKITDESFYVPYRDKFEEGEFRKRIPFMYTGKLQKVRFIYKGPDINAVLDRLPTAEAKQQKDGTWKVTAEVFGDLGFQMWAKSQGSYIEAKWI
ncbi:MAG: WYL domain-containing protein [Eubacteriales bacterium]|nr:WYL domain-containing protein [Eubacteriales bacterium]